MTPSSATPVRIIGIGSPFGDDQAGWHIVETLEQDKRLKQFSRRHLSFIKSDRPGAGLLDLMHGARLVILVDAMKSGAAPGSIRRLEGLEIEDATTPLSSHGFGVASSLSLARALDDMPARLVLYGIEAGSTEGFEHLLSPYEINKISEAIAADIGRLDL